MELLYYSLNTKEIQELNPDAKIWVYPELNNIKDVKQLFQGYRKVIILYLIQAINKGHWVCLFLDKNNNFHFFDSAGFNIDFEMDSLTPKERKLYNENNDNLKRLLSKYKVNYNRVQVQNEKYSTCGFFVSHRLKYSNLNEKEYLKLFKNVQNPDLYVIKNLLNLK
jgi:hypothetical protein